MNVYRKFRHVALIALMYAALGPMAHAEALKEGFVNPPNSARPRVWWHWMNGNITKEGIRKDLEWMQRAGIGGVQNFDVNLETPKVVTDRLVYMTPPWKDAFRYAVELAEEKGLEFAVATSPGWSESGGPWVKPEDGIKKLVWSESRFEGGRHVIEKLPAPPTTTGAYLDLPLKDEGVLIGDHGARFVVPSRYVDVAVLAFPMGVPPDVQPVQVRAGDGTQIDADALIDESLATSTEIPAGTRDDPKVIELEYAKPLTIRSVSLFAPGTAPSQLSPGLLPRFEASDDRQKWRNVTTVVMTTVPSTASFAPVTAKYFRIVFAPNTAGERRRGALPQGVDLGASLGAMTGNASRSLKVADLRLSTEAKVNLFEAKAGFAVLPDYYSVDEQAGVDISGVDPKAVVDLTNRLRPDGTLDWTPTKGAWRVLRFGWSLTGKINHPATDEATGLEVDKLDASAVRRYLERYIDMYRDAAGTDRVGSSGLRALLSDSTEVGSFNWTPRMIEQFKRLRGYDPTPWLPTLAGVIVGSRQRSDAFLYDFRRTLAELHASEHYGTLASVAHENGLKLYGEALENGRPSLGDDLALRSHTDYPMAAMWWFPRSMDTLLPFAADLKGAASVANVFGQNIAAAESMTSAFSPWANAPSDLRRVIDFEFCHGINRPVIHTSVHQPVDDKQPGLSLMMFGQYFNRHETWSEMARPWIDYISRNSYLLQQGRNVADVAYFYGEEAPLTAINVTTYLPDVPKPYAYDFVNADAVLNVLESDREGEIVARSGARYRALYLGGTSRKMTLGVLRRLAELAEAGATIVGSAPESSPGLMDDTAQFAELVKRLWSGQPVTQVGRGRVIATKDIDGALASIGVRPDFSYSNSAVDSSVCFVHRKLDDGDLYFVNNRRGRAENIEARFRIAGKHPEIWHADTGVSEPVAYRIEAGETIVPLNMIAEDSFFVVFRKPTIANSVTVDRKEVSPLAELNDRWDVALQPGRGAPAHIQLAKLVSLSEHPDPGVKYFSGTATYSKRFRLPKGATPGAKLTLDLGNIGDVAEVNVNGQYIGTTWHAPYQIDIGGATKPGLNELKISVANLWVNRLIGDKQSDATRIAWTAIPTYLPTAPLRPSGLIGPVRLLIEKR